MTTGKFYDRDNDRDTKIALIAKDVEYVKGTTEEIKGQLSNFIEKCDSKFTDFSNKLAIGNTSITDIKEDIDIAHKRVDKLSDVIGRSIANHEKCCPSREITMQRLVKPSRPPKDTPREIKQPVFIGSNGSALIPKWFIWIAASVGIGIAVFIFVYSRISGVLGN